MTADMAERDSTNRLDRSNCILPPSSPDSRLAGTGTIDANVDFVQQNKSSSDAISDVSFQTILKASWILTLQCFIVADIICFKYRGPLVSVKKQGQDSVLKRGSGESVSGRYFTRINQREPLWSFLRRLEASYVPSNGVADPMGHDIGVANEHSSRHHCNTGVYFQELKFADLEVSTRNPSHIVGIRAPTHIIQG